MIAHPKSDAHFLQRLVNALNEQNRHKSEYMHQCLSRYVNALLDFSYPQVIHRFETILVDNTLFSVIVVMVYCCGEKWGIVGKLEEEVVGMTILWGNGYRFSRKN